MPNAATSRWTVPVAAIALLSVPPALATMQRTFVSGNGNDAITSGGVTVDALLDHVTIEQTAAASVTLSNSRVHNNGGDGVSFVNSSGTVRGDLLSKTITRNAGFGVRVSGGATVFSNGANLVKHNLGASDVIGSITAALI